MRTLARVRVVSFLRLWRGPSNPAVCRVGCKETRPVYFSTMKEDSSLSFAESFSISKSGTVGDDAIPEEGNEQDACEVGASEVIEIADKALSLRHKSGSAITLEKAVREMCDAYLLLDEGSRTKFLEFLATRDVSRDSAGKLAAEYAAAPTPSKEECLREALTADFIWLFQRVGHLEGGVKFLVDLRADALNITQKHTSSGAAVKSLSSQLRSLLSHWFSIGLLELERVTWESPCAMLQRVSEYEAVHPVKNWSDLKARVGPYRRCFVYTHRSMPGEPIVVLHVALTREVPRAIADVVKEARRRMMVKRFSVETSSEDVSGGLEDSSRCRAAIFYSITSTQRGLQGIELGTHLIKQTVKRLREEIPTLEVFSTLSPIPGFRTWLLTTLSRVRRGEEQVRGFKVSELEQVRSCLGHDQDVDGRLLDLIKTNSWLRDEDLRAILETPLMRLCSRYLYREKHRGFALDPVANFHLRNGAVIWRLNWRADVSQRGLENSCGIMVNYRYFLGDLETNSNEYLESQAVKAGEQIIHLAK